MIKRIAAVVFSIVLAAFAAGCGEPEINEYIKIGATKDDYVAIAAIAGGFVEDALADRNINILPELSLCENGEEIVAGMEAGYIKIGFLSDDECIKAIAGGLGAEIIGAGKTESYFVSPIVVDMFYGRDNEKTVKAVIKGFIDAANYIKNNRKKAEKIIREYTGNSVKIDKNVDYSVKITYNKIGMLTNKANMLINGGEIDIDESSAISGASDIINFVNNSYAY
jgi:hydroxymethylpyrimidine/phosphomethylpyrimidine kinase